MPLQFDNRISWMDILAIAGVAATGITMLFGLNEDISTNTSAIAHIRSDLKRIEVKGDRRDDEILEQLRQQRVEMKEYRRESRESNREVNQKLDRLIERELNGQ